MDQQLEVARRWLSRWHMWHGAAMALVLMVLPLPVPVPVVVMGCRPDGEVSQHGLVRDRLRQRCVLVRIFGVVYRKRLCRLSPAWYRDASVAARLKMATKAVALFQVLVQTLRHDGREHCGDDHLHHGVSSMFVMINGEAMRGLTSSLFWCFDGCIDLVLCVALGG